MKGSFFMKVVLFEIFDKQAVLAYRSGDPLTLDQLRTLNNYILELMSQTVASRPREEKVGHGSA